MYKYYYGHRYKSIAPVIALLVICAYYLVSE